VQMMIVTRHISEIGARGRSGKERAGASRGES
jgi:hypothetical protein